jgi:D-serine deaminase-like pyridoxal phosphate-dependent protein
MVVVSFSNVIAAAGASSANALSEGAVAQISNISVLYDPMKAVLGTLNLAQRDPKPMAVNVGCETGSIGMV